MIPFLTHSLCTNRQIKAQSQDEIVVPVNFLKRCPKYWKRGPLRSCWRLLNWLMEHRDNVQFPFECTACVIASYTYCMDIFHWITEKLRSGTGGVVNLQNKHIVSEGSQSTPGTTDILMADSARKPDPQRTLPINIRHYGPSYDPLVGCNASAASKEREYFNVNLKLIQCTRYNVIL